MDYKPITKEEIEAAVVGMWPKVGDRDYVGMIREGMYQIAPGVYTGIGGWEAFIKTLHESLQKSFEDATDKPREFDKGILGEGEE